MLERIRVACVYSQSSSVSLEIFDFRFEFPHIKFSISCTLMYKVTIRQLEACGGSLYFSLIAVWVCHSTSLQDYPWIVVLRVVLRTDCHWRRNCLTENRSATSLIEPVNTIYLSYITLGTFSNFLKFILSSFPELRLALFKKNQLCYTYHRNAMNGMYEGTSLFRNNVSMDIAYL